MAERNPALEREVVKVLKTIPLFSSCTDSELKAIAASGRTREFDAGKVICTEGETGTGIYVILTGETKVKVGGRTKRTLGPGAFFGEVAILDGGPRTATVVADTPVRTLGIPFWNFRKHLKENPKIAIKMLEEVCRRLRNASDSLTD